MLAFDLGDVRTGVAVSDDTRTIVTPVTVLETAKMKRDAKVIKNLFDDYETNECLIGLPLTLAGEEGPQARHIRSLADRLFFATNAQITFFDERLSTSQAQTVLGEGGAISTKQKRGIDAMAAAIFLQAYLDGERAKL